MSAASVKNLIFIRNDISNNNLRITPLFIRTKNVSPGLGEFVTFVSISMTKIYTTNLEWKIQIIFLKFYRKICRKIKEENDFWLGMTANIRVVFHPCGKLLNTLLAQVEM
jgi:hypothetical protein